MDRSKFKTGPDNWDLDKETATIDGEEYPLFYAKIINKMIGNELPFVLFLGKPGTGKTEAATRLGYDLTEKIGFYEGPYKPSRNVFYDNIEFMEELYEQRRRVLHKPDINATLSVMNHHNDQNRAFETMIHLSRINGNLITGDGQLLWRMDTGIQHTHTFRLVATGPTDTYAWHVYYINREPDSDNKKVSKKFLGTWEPERPPSTIQTYIKERDRDQKQDVMKDAINRAKGDVDGLKQL